MDIGRFHTFPSEKWHRIIARMAYAVMSLSLLYFLWLTTRCFITDYFSIPTFSMIPTLYPGDKVWVNKMTMGARIYTSFDFDLRGGELRCRRLKGLRRVKCNDIVVFNFPYHNGKMSFVINQVYCKRVAAVPGDSIRIENGYYKNNNHDSIIGSEKMQSQLAHTPDSVIPGYVLRIAPYDAISTIKNMPSMYVPHKGDIIRLHPYEGVRYKMLLEWETGMTITLDWKKNKVYANGKELRWHRFKHDYYFMVGDNVADSNDSRYWGLVPEEYIVGIVAYIHHGSKRKAM